MIKKGIGEGDRCSKSNPIIAVSDVYWSQLLKEERSGATMDVFVARVNEIAVFVE